MFFYEFLWSDRLYIVLKKHSFHIAFLIMSFMFVYIDHVKAFDLIPLLPENQIKKDINYYDLRVQPGQKQTLELLVRNYNDTSITLYFNLTTAMTNNLGTVDYLVSDEEYVWDDTLPFQFSDIAFIPHEVIVPPKSEGIIPIELQMPEQPFEGMVLGAVEVQSDSQSVSQVNETMQINQKVRYLILMKLTESDQKVSPNIIWQGISYDSMNHSLILNIRNPVGAYLFNLDLHILIQTQNNVVVFEKNIQHLEMAPYSYLDYILSLDDIPLEKGMSYKVITTITSDEGQQYVEDVFTYIDHSPDQEVKGDFAHYQLKLLLVMILLGGIIIVSFVIKKIRKDVI